MKSVSSVNNREQTIGILKELSKNGYTHVVRDKNMPYLTCFSLKPKRYLEIESWGYVNPNVANMPAYPIKNKDITEINWSNRSATLIADFLVKVKEGD